MGPLSIFCGFVGWPGMMMFISLFTFAIALAICFGISWCLNWCLPKAPLWALALLNGLITLILGAAMLVLFYMKAASMGCSGGECGPAQMILPFLALSIPVAAAKDMVLSWLLLRFIIRRPAR